MDDLRSRFSASDLDDEGASAYEEGFADGFASGFDEGAELLGGFSLRRKALEAAAETARGLRAAHVFGSGAAAADDVIAYARFLLGEPEQPVDDE